MNGSLGIRASIFLVCFTCLASSLLVDLCSVHVVCAVLN